MTDFLFARATFLSGVASVLDLGGTLGNPNMSRNTTEADFMALRSDWLAVGNDMREAISSGNF